MGRACIGLVILWFSTTTAHAETRLTLHDAIAHAVASNPTLATSTLVLDESEAAQEADAGRYDARLEVQATGHAEREQPRVATPLSQQLARDAIAGSAAIVKTTESGGELRAGVGLERDADVTRIVGGITHDDFAQRTIRPRVDGSVRQALLGGREVGGAIRDRLASEREAAAHDREATAAVVLRDVEHAYWQLYLAQEEVTIRGDAAAAAQTQLDQVKAEIARGSRPRLAAAEIEEELARRREDELVATGAVGERSLDLSRLLGIAPTSELRTRDAIVGVPLAAPQVTTPPQLRAADARVAAADARVAETEDTVRWRIDATLSGSVSAPRDRWRDALDDAAGYGGWTIELGLTVRAPLTDRAAHGQIAGAHARALEARVARADAAAELAAAILRSTNRRDVARQRREALQRARELADQNLTAEQNRWERGDTTAYEVLRRQAAVGEARLRVLRAQVDELDAEAALAAATGELLARRGITLR